MTIKEVDGSVDPGVMVVIDRFLTLPHYRKRGYGKATFGQCLMDILTMMEEAGVAVSRISVFIPAKAECLYAAQTVLKFGLQNVATGPRPTDPTGTANPEFYKDSGVQEFTVSASVLLEAFKSAGGGAGAASVAAGMAGGAAAAAGMGMGMGGAMPTA
jgi:GNAT superfamily N-acetyltransferase